MKFYERRRGYDFHCIPYECRIARQPHAHRVRARNSKMHVLRGGHLCHADLCAAPPNDTGGLLLQFPLGSNIRRLRRERAMTQRQLAYHLRVSVQAVSKWERGCAYPDISLLVPIARLFSVTLDQLFGNDAEW